jgi:hypothetical protein
VKTEHDYWRSRELDNESLLYEHCNGLVNGTLISYGGSCNESSHVFRAVEGGLNIRRDIHDMGSMEEHVGERVGDRRDGDPHSSDTDSHLLAQQRQ